MTINEARADGTSIGALDGTEVAPARIAVVANIAWHLHNFRMGLIEDLEAQGHTVVMMAAPDDYARGLTTPDRPFAPLDKLKRTGMNPFHDLALFRQMLRTYRAHRIDVAIHYTSKGNIYGGLASRLLGIPSIHTINGLGGPFSGRNASVRRIVAALYRKALARSNDIYFQNTHDFDYFVRERIISCDQGRVVAGSGIDLNKFKPAEIVSMETNKHHRPKALLFSRLSRTKGILEYVEAARLTRDMGKDIEFQLAGRFDHDRHAISREEIAQWERSGLISFLGQSDNIIKLIAASDFVVYPSYYMEGIPRALIEACAMAKPIVTTDHVGCRETVITGENGMLVPTRDANALATAIVKMASLRPERRKEMGAKSRLLAQERFDQNIVNAFYLSSVERLFNK
ncbi:MAG: glycosyltransferase family 4 protein [Pseudomonadota bacterium]